VVGFATAVNDAGPVPVPEAPVDTVSQLALLAAVQPHAAWEAVTVVDAVPPVAGTFWLVGASE
jgi:hypothetical protein